MNDVAELSDSTIERRTEERLARMIAYVRFGTVFFVYIPPIFAWNDLRYPLIATAAALASTIEAGWVVRRVWFIKTTSDLRLITIDVSFCLALMLIGSQAADPSNRNTLMTVLLPFTLACPALLGLGLGLTRMAVFLLTVLAAGWAIAIYPYYTVKLASDMMGFALWLVLAHLIARELRDLASRTAAAQRDASRIQGLFAEHQRKAAIARERAAAHREIHDYLLPIVERVAVGENNSHVHDAARKGLARARRFLEDDHLETISPFGVLVTDLRNAFTKLIVVINIEIDPPHDVGEAIIAAIREALNNARKHAATDRPVNLYVSSTASGVEVVVRDRGKGFDMSEVRAGGGFRRTFPTLDRHGIAFQIESSPGNGTKVVIRWPDVVRDASTR